MRLTWRIDPGPSALEQVRHRLAEAAAHAPEDAIHGAQMVAVELVTNAWLHGRAPIVLTIDVDTDAVTVSVSDNGRGVPMLRPSAPGATVGRGLHLVAALAAGWGVGAAGNGKVVWARVPFERDEAVEVSPEIDVDELLASWHDEPTEAPRKTVQVTGVPVGLLESVSGRIAGAVRELRLLMAAAESGGAEPPAGVADLAEALEYDWGEGQRELHRQLASAKDSGAEVVDITLRFPASGADVAERFLAATDAADGLARAGRLLMEPSPASQVAFRHWWIGTIVAQLRAADGPRPPQQPFADVLVHRLDEMATRAAAWNRLQVLQQVTGQLAGATTPEEVARVVVDSAAKHLGAAAARVYLVEGNTLRSLAWHGGLGPSGDVFEFVPLGSDLPGAEVVRTGRPLLLRNLDEITASFPRLADYYPSQRALHIHPIVIGARVLGVLGLTFGGNGVEESEQVAFVQALADALAQALDRTQALARAQARADRLRLVADASLALNQSLDVKDTLDAVTHVLVPGVADWAIVQVLRNGKLENASVHHPDPAKLQWANSVEGRWPVDMSAPRGAPAVLRTGQSELYAEISDELIAAGAVDDEHLAALRALGIRSVLIVPLTGRSGPVGALTLIYAESGRRYGPDDLPLVEDIARRAAFAIETAETFRQQSGRLADVVRVADAAQRAILSEIPARIGPLLLSSAYRSSAREATVGGDLFEAVPYRGGARVLIGDVRGKGLSAIRTASLVLGAARAAAEDVEDLTEVMTTVDRRLRRHLGDEDFVTACIVEIATDGSYRVASAGHPAPLLVRAGVTGICEVPPSLPLGLGAAPAVVDGHLAPGDRLVLFTDGLLEARDENRAFVPLERLAPAMAAGRLDDAVEGLVRRLTSAASRLDDDLAVLAVEYTGIPTQPGAVEDVAPAQFESP